VGAFILAFPYLINVTAYYAVTSIAVIGLYISYLIPVFLRRINPSSFHPGPWVLSKTWGPIINWIAIVWVIFICILLMLPQVGPLDSITRDTFNYAPIAVLVVIGGAWLWWVVSARKWFKGPKVQGTPEELAEIERDLSI
jgi:amino acid transporter